MAFGAQILADSRAPNGRRLTTFEIAFPRYIQAEVNTHTILSKNSGSSRAIPVNKMLARLEEDPYYPVYWGSNKKGMQAGAELEGQVRKACEVVWRQAMTDAMGHAKTLRDLGLHKQDANRILEPWMWQTVIITGTEWDNFFHLRNHPDAHPAFSTVAAQMQELYEELEPVELGPGQWHLPLVDTKAVRPETAAPSTGDFTQAALIAKELEPELWENNATSAIRRLLIKVSAGRCARVSVLTHDGERDLRADVGLHDRLLASGHMSPFQHQARPIIESDFDDYALPLLVHHKHLNNIRFKNPKAPIEDTWCGNYRGWVPYRKTIPGEFDIMGSR